MAELEPGWLWRQIKETKKDMKLIGGFELHEILAHARKRESKIRKLQKQLRELKAQEGLANANKRKNNSR